MKKYLKEILEFFEDLGEISLQLLLDKKNRGAVKHLCRRLMTHKHLPTELKVGDRVYKILSYMKENEEDITIHEFIKRAIELKANLGQEDAQYLVDHQQDIPDIFTERNCKVTFWFPDWRGPEDPDNICFLSWRGGYWHIYFGNSHCLGRTDRVLRRIK